MTKFLGLRFDSKSALSRIALILSLSGITILNVFKLFNTQGEIKRITMYKKVIPRQNIGHEFAGLNTFLHNVKYLGFYTDRNEEDIEGSKLFSHAQFVLAPIILDYNNASHEYVLFVCKNEDNAWRKMSEIGAEPLLRNKSGMILGKRKP